MDVGFFMYFASSSMVSQLIIPISNRSKQWQLEESNGEGRQSQRPRSGTRTGGREAGTYGFQRKMGLRAAVVSSSRVTRVV